MFLKSFFKLLHTQIRKFDESYQVKFECTTSFPTSEVSYFIKTYLVIIGKKNSLCLKFHLNEINFMITILQKEYESI